MSYVVDVNRPVNLEFRQAVNEQLESARRHLLGAASADSERAIHEFRKATKRLRAILRLLEGTAPSKAVRSARRRLAKMARELAGPRELSVAHHTLSTVYQVLGRPADAPPLPVLAPSEIASRLDHARRELEHHASPILELFDGEFSPECMLRGLMLSYEKGQRGFAEALRRPKAETLHQLRKRVKDRLYQQRLLVSLSPRNFKRENALLDELGELLGEHHDLVRLRALMRERPKAFGRVPWVGRVEAGIRLGLRAREAKLRPLCEELYREPVEARAHRLAECLRSRRRAAKRTVKRRTEAR